MHLRSLKYRRAGILILGILLIGVITPPLLLHYDYNTPVAQTSQNMASARIAIYNVQRYDNFSFIACIHLFEWMNASVELVSATEIQHGALDRFDLLVLPAHGPSTYERDLTPLGKERIRQFLATGGSLFSVCRGTEFAVIQLGLIDATLHYFGPIGVQCHDTHNGELAVSEMIVNRASTGPDLSEEPESYMVFTTGASYFELHDNTPVIPLLSYAESGLPGVIAFRYGQGTVCLSSPHPEFEEGTDRDGLSADHISHWPTYQTLYDPDSEWGFLYKVSCWLIASSPGIPSSWYLNSLALIGGVFSIVMVVTLAIDIQKRRR
ncbi:MAG: hypothetical protein ACFFDU_09280 [Candidatus Thorarchaeota archaeon]